MRRPLLALALLSGSMLTAAPAVPLPAPLLRQLEATTAEHQPGVAVLVARDGQIVFQAGFGFADVEHNQPITAASKFRIGSVTKQFTAAAILRLAEQHRLRLDDTLATYFSDFPNGAKITLRQLLTHTSGIHSYTEKTDFLQRVAQPIAPDELVAWFRNDPPDFAPGKGFRYDNSGYFLLGLIVEKVSGRSYAQFLQETFFGPLGMKDTGVYRNAAPPPGMAKGYSFAHGTARPALDWDMSWAGGAGALYSTVGDLERWTEALFSGRVLNAESFRAATTPVELPPGADGLRYGFGLVISSEHGLPTIGHNGGLNGWSSVLTRYPEQHVTIVVLGNALPPSEQVDPARVQDAIAKTLLASARADAHGEPQSVPLDAPRLEAYVGHYDYKSAVLDVTRDGDRLFAQLTGQPRFEIFPQDGDAFFWKVTEARVTFQRDATGTVVGARHEQSGQVINAPRIIATADTAPDKLAAYVGRYQYAPGEIMAFTRRGTQLYGQLTGQPKFPVFPAGPNRFEWHVVTASVEFVRAPDGQVTEVRHTQNGHTLTAPRIK